MNFIDVVPGRFVKLWGGPSVTSTCPGGFGGGTLLRKGVMALVVATATGPQTFTFGKTPNNTGAYGWVMVLWPDGLGWLPSRGLEDA